MFFPWREGIGADAGGYEKAERSRSHAEAVRVEMRELPQGELVVHAMAVESWLSVVGFDQRRPG